MKLDKDSVKIVSLFSGQKQYKIPRYQRRYVWDNTNWETLWQDIIQFPNKHFTGTVITYKDEEDKFPEIVDGQQRLTTFQVIFCIIRDLFESGEYMFSPEVNVDRLKNRIQDYIELDNKEHRLISTKKDDGEAFQSIVSREIWQQLETNSTVLEAFQTLLAKEMKCHRLFRPQFSKFKTSFFVEIREVSDTLTLNADVSGDTPVR